MVDISKLFGGHVLICISISYYTEYSIYKYTGKSAL